jgi:hypothetical protein
LGIFKKWKRWSLPTKLTLVFALLSFVVSTLALFDVPRNFSAWAWPSPPPPYDVALDLAISDLHRSNICLATRLITVSPDENPGADGINDRVPLCKLDLAGLHEFTQAYTNYLALIPYNGAESLAGFTDTLMQAQDLINDAEGTDQLVAAQNEIRMSMAEVGFWMCGLEWWLGSAPEAPSPAKKSIESQIDLAEIWDQWDDKNGKLQAESVERRKNFQQDDRTNRCTGFIDLLD